MIYYHNKLKKYENISLKNFTKVVEFLEAEKMISKTFYEHHTIYEYYKDQLAFSTPYEAKQSTLANFSIGKVTFHNIKKRFRDI